MLFICYRTQQKKKHNAALERVRAYDIRRRIEENDEDYAENDGDSHLDDEEDDQKAEPMLPKSQARASFNLLENVST